MDDVNHLYFDNNFFGKLVCKPRSSSVDAWQRYFFELLNSDFRPYKTFCTPLQFLEFIGIRPPRRPRTISLLPENWRELLKKGALGEAVAARIGQSYERAIQYYSNQHTLSVAAMTVRANQQANLHTANRNFAHVLVTETYQRFKALEGFERYVYQSLAVDHLQQQLLHERACEATALVNKQLLHDLLRARAEGYNNSLFRVLRAIYLSVEPEIIGENQKTVIPFEGKDGLVDSEVVHYGLLGYVKGTVIAPVTVFTLDAPLEVRNRLTMFKYVYELFTHDILRETLTKHQVEVPETKPGHVLCCSETSPGIREKIDVSTIDTRLETLQKVAN